MSELKAGRELDARIHDEVFGLIVREERLPAGIGVLKEEVGMVGPWFGRRESDGSVLGWWQRLDFVDVPHYSTSIADAWEVLEKMRETCWTHVDGIGRPQKVWRATFAKMGGDYRTDCTIVAETAPLAICLAALKSVSPNNQKQE